MAQFFKPKKSGKPVSKTLKSRVSALDHQARGVVRGNDRKSPTRFVAGALPGELIQYQTTGKHSGVLEQVLEPIDARRDAPCPYYERCGGCDFQHTNEAYQQGHKRQVIEQLFQKFGVCDSATESLPWQAPLVSEPIRYRRRIRLATRWLGKEQRLLVGFREAQSHRIVAVDSCLVAQDTLMNTVKALYPVLNSATIGKKLGHIEVIHTNQSVVLLRITETLASSDRQRLEQWQKEHGIAVWLESETDCLSLGDGEQRNAPPFDTSIDGDTLYFQPGDFLQVNAKVNERMVQQAMDWLKPGPGKRVYDFFAGIGNFSLPLARRARSVLAVEGVYRMAEQTQKNAELNGLTNLTSLSVDLNEVTPNELGSPAELWCLDPARPGADGVINLLKRLKPEHQPERILYVSCAPDTLARDLASLLTPRKGQKRSDYRITRLGTVDMFPQTHHIETMVCLERV